jgi:hypothetical protein
MLTMPLHCYSCGNLAHPSPKTPSALIPRFRSLTTVNDRRVRIVGAWWVKYLRGDRSRGVVNAHAFNRAILRLDRMWARRSEVK